MIKAGGKIANLNKRERDEDFKLFIYGILVGVTASIFAGFYRYLIKNIENIHLFLAATIHERPYYLLLCLPVIVVLAMTVAYLQKLAPYCGGSGIPQVEAEIKGYIDPPPLKLLIAKIVGGACTALAGMALGREGPSIQIGAMSGKYLAAKMHCNKTTERILLTCGAGAGLAAAFNAPVAGVLFAVEEVHRHVSRKLLVTVMAATVSADVVAKACFGNDTVFQFDLTNRIALTDYWLIFIFGVVLSLAGVFYSTLLRFLQARNKKIREKFVKLPAFVTLLPYFLLPLFFLYLQPLLLGGGHHMFTHLEGDNLLVKALLSLFILKLFFAVFSFSSGVPGGIFFPILALGATAGAVFALCFAPDNINSYMILGMAGYLTAIVRAPLTSIVLIFEMTGNITYLLPLSLICLSTYALSNYLNSAPIYEYLLEKLKQERGLVQGERQERVLLDFVVADGSGIVNKKVKELLLPEHCLLVNIERDGESLIPRGETVLLSGDVLEFLSNERDLYRYYDEISKLCSVAPLLEEYHEV